MVKPPIGKDETPPRVTPDSEAIRSSKKIAREQHRRWLGEDKQTPGEPYHSERVSTPPDDGTPNKK